MKRLLDCTGFGAIFFFYLNEVKCTEVKFVFSKKATKFDKIFTDDLTLTTYSRVHKSSDSFFSKILEKPSIVQKKMIPHIKGLDFSQR